MESFNAWYSPYATIQAISNKIFGPTFRGGVHVGLLLAVTINHAIDMGLFLYPVKSPRFLMWNPEVVRPEVMTFNKRVGMAKGEVNI
jgi:hypothetical protein